MSPKPPRDTRPMASFGGRPGVPHPHPDEFDTRKTVVFERVVSPEDGSTALVPISQQHPPLVEQLPRGVPPRGMAVSAQIDAFRELRTRLLAIAAGLGLKHFTTLVVPIALDSGASFVARNLAAAFALQEQGSAVLVDCDFRNPTQQALLNGAQQGDGLSDYLDQTMHLAALQPLLLNQLVVPTAISGLHLIPAGRCEAMLAGRPREYFSSKAMLMLMSHLREESSYIVLDGPALSGSPDARILSGVADIVILVVAYGQSSHDDIVKGAEMFDRAKFAGVVFNDRGAGPKATPRRR